MTGTAPLPPGWSDDPAALAAAGDDFGHLVHRAPRAVVRAGSVEDVVAACRYAAGAGLPVVARGAGHATSGAGQVAGGLVVDMGGLDRVCVPSGELVRVEAGARWSAVLDAALAGGLTPPTLTDYLETTVGGTLAVGGIGGGAHLYGPQVDGVAGLEVVTVGGERVECGPSRRAEAFDAALAGGGREVLIVGATLALVPAPGRVRLLRLSYDDADVFVRDQLALCGDPRWCHLEGQAVPEDGIGWRYLIEAATDGVPELGGLGYGAVEVSELTYRELAHRMAPGVRELIATGDWYRPHPWFSAFVPASRIRGFLAEVMPALRPSALGPLPVLIYPLRRGARPAPGLATPGEETFFTVSVLRTCDFADAAAALADNVRLLRVAEAYGGTWYPVGILDEIPVNSADASTDVLRNC